MEMIVNYTCAVLIIVLCLLLLSATKKLHKQKMGSITQIQKSLQETNEKLDALSQTMDKIQPAIATVNKVATKINEN